MGANNEPKGANMPLILTGAIASCFVGIMYAYSYLKTDIKSYWLYQAGTDADMAENFKDMVDLGYFAGFTGQYLAPIPGLIFDLFGDAVTCWYGGLLCAIGFSMVGFGTSMAAPWVLVIGVFFAGLGSKGLGFGALLGTMNALPNSYSTFISGLYLGFDAASSILAIMLKDIAFKTEGIQASEKGGVVRNFFVTLGVIIGIVGVLSAGIMYKIFGNKKDEEADDEDEDTPERPSVNNPRISCNSVNLLGDDEGEGQRRSSIVREAELMSMQRVAKDGAKDEEERVGLIPKDQPERKTFWMGVICCFVVMLLSESQGLAFNSLIGDCLIAARKSTVAMVTFAKIKGADKQPDHAEDHKAGAWYNVHHDIRAAHKPDFAGKAEAKDVGEKIATAIHFEFNNLPTMVKVVSEGTGENEKHKIVFEHVDKAADGVTLIADPTKRNAREFPLAGKFDDKAKHILDQDGTAFAKDHAKFGIKVNGAAVSLEDVITGKHGLDKESPIAKAVSSLAPVAGWQELFATLDKDGKPTGQPELVLVSHVLNSNKDKVWAESTFDQADYGKARGNFQLLKTAIKLDSLKGSTPAKDLGIFKDNRLATKVLGGEKLNVPKKDDEKRQFVAFKYPEFAEDVPELQSMPFRKWVSSLEAKVDPADSTKKSIEITFGPKAGGLKRTIVLEKSKSKGEEDLKVVYDPRLFIEKVDGGDSHEHATHEAKKYLTIVFALGNAIGRLGLGVIADRLASKCYWFPPATWFVVGCLSYAFLLGYLGMFGIPATTAGSTGTPFSLYLIVFFTAFTYGGVFTINTAYLKKITVKALGLVLGTSLLVLAIGAKVFGFPKFAPSAAPAGRDVPASIDDVSEIFKKNFFLVGAICQLIAIVPAVFCWYSSAAEAKKARDEEE